MKKITFTITLLFFTIISVFSQTTIIDFDGIAYEQGGWNGTTEIVTNPHTDGINTSANVCKYITPANAAWGNCAWITIGNTIEFKDLEYIQFMVLAPSSSQMYVKFENNSVEGEKQAEAYATPIVSSKWQLVTLNFSGLTEEEIATATFDKFAFFFNANDATGGEEWYYDNVVVYTKGTTTVPIEPEARMNLQISDIGSDSFTVTWENDENTTTGTNIFIEDPASGNGNKYIATVASDITSYTFQGELDGATITEDGFYIARLQALPDNNGNAYSEIGLNMVEHEGNTFAFDPNFHIYLCFGQSNMEGSATIETQDRTVDSRFQVLQSLDCANLDRDKAKWYSAVPPLCQCHTGLSVSDYFGRTMIENTSNDMKIGIVQVAIGGSDIRLFDKDIYTNYTSTYTEAWFQNKINAYGGNPYQHLIDIAKTAQESGVIKGIIMHQGETNMGDDQWPTYVKNVYENILTDLSLDANSVPLLAGEVAHEDQEGSCASMNSIIGTLPETIPTAHVISSSGCTVQSDYTHFDSEGAREMGKRYAQKMISISETITAINKVSINKGFSVEQNIPNPAIKSTNISFVIPNTTYVSLKIYNMQGVKVTELAGKQFASGKHTVKFNTEELSTGIYFYTINAGNFSATQKMIIQAD